MKTKFAHSNFRRDKTLSLTIGYEAEHIFFLIYIKSVWASQPPTPKASQQLERVSCVDKNNEIILN